MARSALWTVLGVLACAACCQAEEEFNVDLRVGWDNCHRPGQWTPLEITISTTRKEPFNGSLVLSAQQDTVTKMEIRQPPLVITKDTPLRLTPTLEAQAVTRLAAGEPARWVRSRGNYVLIRTSRTLGWVEEGQFGLTCPKSGRRAG